MPTELGAFASEQMAPYTYPRHVWLVPGAPLVPGPPTDRTGKILRREVHPPKEL